MRAGDPGNTLTGLMNFVGLFYFNVYCDTQFTFAEISLDEKQIVCPPKTTWGGTGRTRFMCLSKKTSNNTFQQVGYYIRPHTLNHLF